MIVDCVIYLLNSLEYDNLRLIDLLVIKNINKKCYELISSFQDKNHRFYEKFSFKMCIEKAFHKRLNDKENGTIILDKLEKNKCILTGGFLLEILTEPIWLIHSERDLHISFEESCFTSLLKKNEEREYFRADDIDIFNLGDELLFTPQQHNIIERVIVDTLQNSSQSCDIIKSKNQKLITFSKSLVNYLSNSKYQNLFCKNPIISHNYLFFSPLEENEFFIKEICDIKKKHYFFSKFEKEIEYIFSEKFLENNFVQFKIHESNIKHDQFIYHGFRYFIETYEIPFLIKRYQNYKNYFANTILNWINVNLLVHNSTIFENYLKENFDFDFIKNFWDGSQLKIFKLKSIIKRESNNDQLELSFFYSLTQTFFSIFHISKFNDFEFVYKIDLKTMENNYDTLFKLAIIILQHPISKKIEKTILRIKKYQNRGFKINSNCTFCSKTVEDHYTSKCCCNTKLYKFTNMLLDLICDMGKFFNKSQNNEKINMDFFKVSRFENPLGPFIEFFDENNDIMKYKNEFQFYLKDYYFHLPSFVLGSFEKRANKKIKLS